jgi:osmotically-inducible protein OsmY
MSLHERARSAGAHTTQRRNHGRAMRARAPVLSTMVLATALVASTGALLVTGCIPAIVAVGVGGAMVAVDRRTAGAQVDDQSTETKVTLDAGSRWGNEVHLNVTSYNGNVLLSGEAPTAAVRNEIVQLAKGTEHTRTVYDEMVIGPVTDLGARSNDTFITSKVKARMLDSDLVKSIYVKVVTERSVVYLMGIVSRQEGDAAGQVAATTQGVARVVKLFEYTN